MTRSEEHFSAVRRLEAVVARQDRLSQRYVAAIGTAGEQDAHVRLQASDDQVAARSAWLHWIDDESYRGLDAGPFELLSESVVALDLRRKASETSDGARRRSQRRNC